MKKKIKKYWQQYRIIVILVALLIVVTVLLFPYLSPGRALITNVYATRCSGQWFGADRVAGPPDVLPDADVEKFNPENSAFYRGGDAIIICENFQNDFNKERHKFISARLGLSLAIHEFKSRAEEQETPENPAETRVETVEEESAMPVENPEQVSPEEIEQPLEQPREQPTGESAQPEPEHLPSLENLEQPMAQPEPVSLLQKFNNFIRHSLKFSHLSAAVELVTFSNIFNIFSALAQAEEINENINQVLTNASSTEPLLIEVPAESNQEEDLTPVFLPVEIKTEETVTSTPSQELIPLDAILNIRYLLGENNYYLTTISTYPVSPAINNGYFYYPLPEIKSFDDLEKIKISLEGLLGGYPDLVVYLDSVWLEVTYEEKPAEQPLKIYSNFDDNDWEILVEKDKRIYQITDNDFDDKFPATDNKEIVWQSQINGRWQIFWLDFDEFLAGKKEATQITETTYNNLSPKVLNGQIVWQAWLDNNWEIMTATKNEDGNWIIKRITTDQHHDMSPAFSNKTVKWQRKIDQETKFFKADKIEDNWQIEEIINQTN